MKNLYKIKIHPLSYIITLIFFFTGYFKKYIIFMIIILVHELGHILTSLYFKWKIDKIIILPFGGLTKFDELINRPLKEEFIIAIMGIVFQIIFTFKINVFYNTIIILFNLLPIFPLDGSKILNILFNKISNYKSSLYTTFFVSYIFIILISILILIKRDLVGIIVVITLLFQLNLENKKINSMINKFYLERHLYNFKFKKRKIIKNINKMKRDYTHIIIINKKYITEKEFLRKLFDK